ncbi:MAG: nucleotidyltransferase family protein [Leptospirillum sp.]|nr:sugar phosphate nucleotidyltransferase [Nitrospiraceae bacterium]
MVRPPGVTGFVLMAGAGSRLRGIFPNTPKPLVPVGGVPLGIRVIRQMASAGISRIIVNLHHDAQTIREGISRWLPSGVDILWSFESSVMGTGGGIIHAKPYFQNEDLLVIATCDILSGYDLEEGISLHRKSGARASLVLSPFGPKSESGRIALTQSGGIAFPPFERGEDQVFPVPHFFTGIHLISPDVLRGLGDGLSLPYSIVDLYREYLGKGGFIRGQVTYEPWLDLGTEDGYLQRESFLKGLRQGGTTTEM